MATQFEISSARTAKVVVATSAMLSFISFWRAAAIVLNGLGSSAYYAGGIAEQAVGHAAPWLILGVMLFSYAVRAVYIESCAMFTRGGVYRVVKEAMGGTLAKLSVSALMFDYILTGPISGVSAGQYIVKLAAETATYFGFLWQPSKATVNLLATGLAVLITLYFWWRNTKGIHESSADALRIMFVTTTMVVLLILWGGLTILTHPDKQKLPPAPAPRNLSFNRDAVGWLPKIAPGALSESQGGSSPTAPEQTMAESRYRLAPNAGALLGLIGILIAFGHSVLAMSGEETLAQVNRELEYPKHKNLMRAGVVIFVYSLLFTSLVSFFAYAIIPDQVRPQYFDNLISGIAMNLAGPWSFRLLFQGFIVVAGFLMLAGAVNTAIIGSNGVLNRVSEDGVLTEWFRAPHKKYGTTYRMIDLIVLLQLVTIIGSRGNVYLLGEAYAFGVIWSFAFNALAVLVLRFKGKRPPGWEVPFYIKLDGMESSLGLGMITRPSCLNAGIKLSTKEVATVSGVAFTLIFFTVFLVSERINERKRRHLNAEVDQFNLQTLDIISPEAAGVRPGNTLCLVRDYRTLTHLSKALEITPTTERDLVVLTVRVSRGPHTGYEKISAHHLFTSYEQLLFSKVVALAEKAGKTVHLLVIPSSSVFEGSAHAAAQLESVEVIAGRSAALTPREQARRFGRAWEKLPTKPQRQIRFVVIDPDGEMHEFPLRAHVPS